MERKCICKRCGKEFTTQKNAQKFCSEMCRKAYNIFGKKLTEFECAWCGKKFTAERRRKFCCEQCQKYASGRLKRKNPKQKNFMSIEEVARASREMNMSAGEYMVKYCYGKE